MRLFAMTFAAIGLSVASASAATITNGSLTGPVGNSVVPPGWSIARQSPDTNDVNNNVGGGIPFAATPSVSPDGGTWVGIGGDPIAVVDGATFNESIATTIFDLVPNTNYVLSWYAANFGAETGPGYTGAGAIQALIDGTPIGTGGLLNLGDGWDLQNVGFLATSATAVLSFQLDPATLTRSYLSIDGVSIRTSVQPIPLPASVFLLLGGLATLGAVGRRRARRDAA